MKPMRRRSRRMVDPESLSEFDRLDENIKPYVSLVREAYIRARETFSSMRNGVHAGYIPPKSYEGSPPIYGEGGLILQKERPSVWIRLAGWFARYRIDPALYISTQFSRVEYVKTPPEPNRLITRDSMIYWIRQASTFSDQVRLDLEVSTKLLAQEITVLQMYGDMDMVTATLTALANMSLSMTPLYRYCIAHSVKDERMDAILNRFRAKAYVQFCEQEKHYLTHWTEVLPTGFVAEAKKYYEATYASLIAIGVDDNA